MILYKLKKKRSHTYIIFEENIEMDPVEKWFIDIKKITKSNNVKNCSTIVRIDLEQHLNFYLNNGWEIQNL